MYVYGIQASALCSFPAECDPGENSSLCVYCLAVQHHNAVVVPNCVASTED